MSRAKEATAAVGSVAPDFILHDTEGAEWQMSAQHGRVVVLLFYPGDETPVCTKQLCSVRDNWESYAATGAEVVGISTDTVESHRKFTDHHQLPLRLLADTEGKVHKAYDASSWFPGRAARAVVIVDAQGIIRYRKVETVSLFRPRDAEIVEAIRAAQQQQQS
ncbi:MAG: thioredoxin-dependent peroxiredoxin [Pyrinomonadaceae bacterium]|nr:thioredoxin-dependent peroxiredoxin [Pyrinomonadaceae bacterium]